MPRQASPTATGQEIGTTLPRRKRENRPLSVRALARPAPDLGRLAQLVVHLAVQAAKEQADDPDVPAEERQRSQTSSTLLSQLESQPVRVIPPRTDRQHQAGRPSQPTPRTMPTAIAAKLNEASACHNAGSHLAAALVARSAVADILQDFGERASSDDLASVLTGLVDQRHLSQQTAALAASQRCPTVVPTYPPVTPDEVQTLQHTVALLVAELYQARSTE